MKNISFILVILLFSIPSYNAEAQSKKLAAEMIQNHLLEATEPQETRPTLDPRLFSKKPVVASTYETAKQIPHILDKMYCYCNCAINPKFKHKSLLTCYTDEHASMCGICMRQAMVSLEMTKAGKTPVEISEHFKKQYVR
jgi:hypothetical protein